MLLRVDPIDNLPPVIYQLNFSHTVAYPSNWLARSLEAQPLALERNKPLVADKSSWLVHIVHQVCFDLSTKSIKVDLTPESHHDSIYIGLNDQSFEKVSSIVSDVQNACQLAKEELEHQQNLKNRSLELSRTSSRSSTDSDSTNHSSNFIASVFSIFSTNNNSRSDSPSPPSSPTPSNGSGKFNSQQSPSRLLRSRARASLADCFRRFVLPALKIQLLGIAEENGNDSKSNIDYYEFIAQSKISAHRKEIQLCGLEAKRLQALIDQNDNTNKSRKGALAVLQDSLVSNPNQPSLRQLKSQSENIIKRRNKLENKVNTLKSTLDLLQQFTARREAISKEHAAELESSALRRNGLKMASQHVVKHACYVPRKSSPLRDQVLVT